MKRIVITGGTGGLGKAVAEVFRNQAWQVENPGSRELDVRDRSAVTSYFRTKPVDLLVCCAGITRDAPLAKLSESSWDEVMAVNFQGARLCAEAVLPEMISRRSGHIVLISSYSAIHPPAGQAAYAASKAALIGLADDLAAAHGPANIRINVVLPGFLETAMTAGLTDERRAKVLECHHLGRFNTPEAVAEFIHFLETRLPHTSGQVFNLDSRPPGN